MYNSQTFVGFTFGGGGNRVPPMVNHCTAKHLEDLCPTKFDGGKQYTAMDAEGMDILWQKKLDNGKIENKISGFSPFCHLQTPGLVCHDINETSLKKHFFRQRRAWPRHASSETMEICTITSSNTRNCRSVVGLPLSSCSGGGGASKK